MKKILLLIFTILLVGCQTSESTSNVEVKNQNNTELVESVNTLDETTANEETIRDVEEINIRAKVTVDVLNLRLEPSIGAEKFGEVYKDSVYQVLALETVSEETWYKISVGDGHEGWVAGWFCEDTNEALLETNRIDNPGLILPSHYGLNDVLVVKDVTTNDLPYEIYIEGYLVEESFTFDAVGSYEYYSKLYDDLGRSDITKIRYINVVEFVDGLCYESVSLDVDTKIVHTLKLPIDPELIVGLVLDYKDSSMAWYEIKVDNKDVCYYPLPSRDLVEKKYDHVVINTSEGRYEFSNMDLLPKIDYIENGYYVFEGDKLIIFNLGDKLVYESPADYRFLNNNSFVSYTDVNRYNFEEDDFFTLKILELKDGTLNTLYIDEVAYSAMEIFKDDENTIRVYGYGESYNDWHYASESVIKDEITYKNVDGIWEKTITNSEFSYRNPITSIDVYDSIDSNAAIRDTVGLESLKEIDYLGNYDIIDGELVMWFRLVLSDGSPAYTYRSRLPYEKGFLLGGQNVHLIMDDGSKIYIESSNSFWDVQTHLNDVLAHLNIYLVSTYYEGTSHRAFSKILNSEVILPFNGYILNSPNKTYFMATEDYMGDFDSVLSIFDYVDNEFVKLYSLSVNGASPTEYEWESDTKLKFMFFENQVSYPSSLTLVEDVWLLETEYDLNN